MRILICDDDPLIIEQLYSYIQFYFEQCHIKCPEIVSFTCGEDLLADNGETDLVFLDIVMPNKDGNAAIEEIMRDDPDATIIIASSIGTQSQLKKAIEAGAKEFIQKPLDQQQVLSTVNRFLEGR